MSPDELPAVEHQAKGGSVVAQTVLGLVHREGIEGARAGNSRTLLRHKANNTLAWRWLRKAADAGFPVAQTEIGEMYYQAHGVDRDLGKSREWLAQAAAANYPRAKLDLLQVQAELDPKEMRPEDAAKALLESLGVSPAPGRGR